MKATYLIHILAGGLGLGAGYVAMWSVKGAALHRRSGMLFVYTMLVMCIAGLLMTLVRGIAVSINAPAAMITSYLIITSLLTVKPFAGGGRWLDPLLMTIALAVGLTCLGFGAEAVASPDGRGRDGMPAFPFFLFGVIGTLAGVLDLRMIRSGPLTGAPRLVRHLWRMCFALFIAAMSFFIGQADEFPKAMRIMPLLALPVLAVLVTMLYWLWRVRVRRSLRGIVAVKAAATVR